ncbi:MAG: amino acid deaminase/aldolase [Candidatus Lokiarchaeota archaeon]|nr:amino acid deaminase/aldolase [Candidatus Lokiarchaeota archaeon]
MSLDLDRPEDPSNIIDPRCHCTRDALQALLADEPCPCAVLDLDAFDHNLALFEKGIAGTGKTVRIGTKSLRVPGLIKRCVDRPGFKGAFLFHPAEIAYLHDTFKIQDFVLAYPVMSMAEADACARAVARDPETKVAVMVDAIPHLHLLEAAAAKARAQLRVLIDVDMAITFLGQLAGVLRSPLRTPEQVVNLAKHVKDFPHLEFAGIMGYEAQEAGVGDGSFLFRRMKAASRKQVTSRRTAVVQALAAEGFHCDIVNGGGSGCFPDTAKEACVTEITVGSGLFKSYIFDPINHLKDFIPSMFMALRVVREPRPGIVTCYSGGYACSGSYLPPRIVSPEGCSVTSREGFGEVQTPVQFDPAKLQLKLGDIVVCRFAKAGEPMERFNEVIAISGGNVVNRFPTYRGAGLWLG